VTFANDYQLSPTPLIEGEVKKIYFPNPYAQLPILKKDGELALVTWGRR